MAVAVVVVVKAATSAVEFMAAQLGIAVHAANSCESLYTAPDDSLKVAIKRASAPTDVH